MTSEEIVEKLKANYGEDIPSLTLKELEEHGIHTGPTLVLESNPRNRSKKKNK